MFYKQLYTVYGLYPALKSIYAKLPSRLMRSERSKRSQVSEASSREAGDTLIHTLITLSKLRISKRFGETPMIYIKLLSAPMTLR
jgi:hypothetical protein